MRSPLSQCSLVTPSLPAPALSTPIHRSVLTSKQATVGSSFPSSGLNVLNYSNQTAILLTSWHLFFATLATQLLFRTSILAAPRSIKMTPALYMARIAPIGLLYSGSLVCSNMAYIYLNVGFIQMLKVRMPSLSLRLTGYRTKNGD